MSTGKRRDQLADGHFYECDFFDPKTRLCTAHDQRPPICSGYPWYWEYPDHVEPAAMQLAYLPRCGYWLDVPQDQIPKFVDLKSISIAVRKLTAS